MVSDRLSGYFSAFRPKALKINTPGRSPGLRACWAAFPSLTDSGRWYWLQVTRVYSCGDSSCFSQDSLFIRPGKPGTRTSCGKGNYFLEIRNKRFNFVEAVHCTSSILLLSLFLLFLSLFFLLFYFCGRGHRIASVPAVPLNSRLYLQYLLRHC